MKPYSHKNNIREFSKDVNEMDLVWHQDKEDRKIEVLEGKGWKFQKDNELPLELKKGDSIYVFSDGFVDQFGGARGKKYKSLKFQDFLLSIQEENMRKQRELLNKEIEDWRGDLEQIDDICIMGVRV